jgi:hypothetical protein
MIDRLERIIALAREQHFGRAAEARSVSRPTLSASIKYLEDMFGVLLVNRVSRFVGFTAEGDRVLEWSRRIVGDARAMRQDIDALKPGLVGKHQDRCNPDGIGDDRDADDGISGEASRRSLFNSSNCGNRFLSNGRRSGAPLGPIASPEPTSPQSPEWSAKGQKRASFTPPKPVRQGGDLPPSPL